MGANDGIHVESLSYSLCDTIKITQKNPLQVSIGPITRSMAHKVKDVSNELIQSI
jgi:mRNA-degrading endonuclease toxin of MazEF toxin-antitoxin module